MNYENEAKLAFESGLFDALNAVYTEVKPGNCKACVRCCTESVNMNYIEFLNILYHCFGDGAEMKKNLSTRRLLEYYLLELVKPMSCPFLNDDRTCEIYAYRPLPCRLFGNAYREDYEKNLRQIHIQNKKFARRLKADYDLKMPKKVLSRAIPFCEDFIPTKQFDTHEIENFYQRILHLDAKLTFEYDLLGHRHNENLVGWFVAYLFSSDENLRELLSELRLDALKELNLKGL